VIASEIKTTLFYEGTTAGCGDAGCGWLFLPLLPPILVWFGFLNIIGLYNLAVSRIFFHLFLFGLEFEISLVLLCFSI
jgi:hypothetical protein